MSMKIRDYLKANTWIWPVIIAFFLRIFKITSSSIWHDEGYTMWLLRYDFGEILSRTARDVHPPGYYLMAKPWVELFGTSEFSVRFLSLLFSVGIVFLVFKIIKDIWTEKAAFWASMFVSLSPFMVRFGQEARMYGVVAFFTTLATYYFVKMIKEKNTKYLLFYVPAMLVAMYTQYYAFFVIISHWVILSIYTKGFWNLKWKESLKQKTSVLSGKWWLANILLLVGYAPWFPVAYAQVTRVADSYWIKPEWITERTIPNNVLHFATYTHFDAIYHWNQYLGPVMYWVFALVSIFGALYVFRNRKKYKTALSIYIFGFLPMILVFTMSKLLTPTYMDRYFPFSAVAVLALWGVALSEVKNRKFQIPIIVALVGTLLVGNYIMHIDVNHQMRALSRVVSNQSRTGDLLVSGELYTHLDGSYYLGYGNLFFISEPVDGYGETSLYYDQQEEYIISQNQVATHDRVWLIGKSRKDYWGNDMWDNYQSITYFDEAGLRATLYTKN
ncbi:glycosyltransferase family 39 protein [Patescibacteria group bacterium]|nr:glycosyltransferase family 39 protein [Patescibacteria group bacterium]